jgi:two-component system NtrC family sensor kinase
MNRELYQVPTFALLAVLVAVFGWLWLQMRSHPARQQRIGKAPPARQRHLLWLAGWWLAGLRLWLAISGLSAAGAGRAVAMVSMQLVPLMFLGSIAPQSLIRRLRIPCVVAFGSPLACIAALVALDPHPGAGIRAVLLACAGVVICVGILWSLQKDLLPVWIGISLVGVCGGACLWLLVHGKYLTMLDLARSGMLVMTALLFASAFRRLTAGLFFTVGGLAVWALPGILETFAQGAPFVADVTRVGPLVRVMTAMGMIVLVMEDEIAANRATHARDQQAQREMQRYAGLYMEAMPYESSQDEYDETCRAITSVSRFMQAAVFLRNAGGRGSRDCRQNRRRRWTAWRGKLQMRRRRKSTAPRTARGRLVTWSRWT